MRMSEWSSDVCSSDLQRRHEQRGDAHGGEDRTEAGARPLLVLEPVGADGQQPRPPDEELEEIHHDQAQGQLAFRIQAVPLSLSAGVYVRLRVARHDPVAALVLARALAAV